MDESDMEERRRQARSQRTSVEAFDIDDTCKKPLGETLLDRIGASEEAKGLMHPYEDGFYAFARYKGGDAVEWYWADAHGRREVHLVRKDLYDEENSLDFRFKHVVIDQQALLRHVRKMLDRDNSRWKLAYANGITI